MTTQQFGGEIFVRVLHQATGDGGGPVPPGASRGGRAGQLAIPGINGGGGSSQFRQLSDTQLQALKIARSQQYYDREFAEYEKLVLKKNLKTDDVQMGMSKQISGFLKIIAGTFTVGAMLSHSKITSTVLGTVADLLGVLVDQLLKPFLPILIAGMKNLAAVVKFVGKFMDDPTAALLELWNNVINIIKQIDWGKVINPFKWGDWIEKLDADKFAQVLVGGGVAAVFLQKFLPSLLPILFGPIGVGIAALGAITILGFIFKSEKIGWQDVLDHLFGKENRSSQIRAEKKMQEAGVAGPFRFINPEGQEISQRYEGIKNIITPIVKGPGASREENIAFFKQLEEWLKKPIEIIIKTDTSGKLIGVEGNRNKWGKALEEGFHSFASEP